MSQSIQGSTRGWQRALLLPLQHGSLGLAGGAGWLLWRGWGDVRARPGHVQPPCAVRAASALGWREGTFVQDINNIHDQLVASPGTNNSPPNLLSSASSCRKYYSGSKCHCTHFRAQLVKQSNVDRSLVPGLRECGQWKAPSSSRPRLSACRSEQAGPR